MATIGSHCARAIQFRALYPERLQSTRQPPAHHPYPQQVCDDWRKQNAIDARLRIRPWVFPVSTNTLQHHHQDLRDKLGLDRDFTIHSLRHTMLTRLGESGADAFTIKRLTGHSSITISERYVHPTPEHVERTWDRFEAYGVPAKVPTVPTVPEAGNEPILVNTVQ